MCACYHEKCSSCRQHGGVTLLQYAGKVQCEFVTTRNVVDVVNMVG